MTNPFLEVPGNPTPENAVGGHFAARDGRKLRYGLATLCVGGGMGIATIVERL